MADTNKGIAGALPAIGIGMDIANAVGGWFGGNERQKQQYNYQRKLNEQMAELQRQNWDYTNAENQRKHYENAGFCGLLEDFSSDFDVCSSCGSDFFGLHTASLKPSLFW